MRPVREFVMDNGRLLSTTEARYETLEEYDAQFDRPTSQLSMARTYYEPIGRWTLLVLLEEDDDEL